MLDVLKSRWGQMTRPPFVRQVVIECPEDWGRVPGEVIQNHPVLRAGFGVCSAWWLSGQPQINDGWAFHIETIIDPWDSLGAETCWQIASNLIKKSDQVLSELLGDTILTAEIVRRCSPRLMTKTRQPTVVVDDFGNRCAAPMLDRWLPGNMANEERQHFRSWVIDDLAADAELLFRLLANRASDVSVGRGEVAIQPLTKEATSTLIYLSKSHPTLATLDDIEAGAAISRATAKQAIDELKGLGYAERPKGPNKGAAATLTGLSVANKLSTKSE